MLLQVLQASAARTSVVRIRALVVRADLIRIQIHTVSSMIQMHTVSSSTIQMHMASSSIQTRTIIRIQIILTVSNIHNFILLIRRISPVPDKGCRGIFIVRIADLC